MNVALIGSGSWGTAVAGLAAARAERVTMWAHSKQTAAGINGEHRNPRYLADYELPGNVVEVHEVFLDDALRLSGEQHEASFNDREREALRRLVSLSNPDWDVLFDIFQRRHVHPLSFLQSRTFMDIFRDVCLAEYPYTPFADAFHTMRSMLLPVLYLLTGRVPKADVYHAISTGYGGLLACLGSSVHHAPVLLTEHGIYTREREEEIIRADWVVPSFKDRWIRFFYLLSEEIYRRAFRVTSLFHNARKSTWAAMQTNAWSSPTAFNSTALRTFP